MKKRRTTRAGASDSGPSENDRGTGPATSVSPAPSQANEYEDWLHTDQAEGLYDADGAESEIEAEYRRRSAGARNMSKRDRRQALRLAREWRSAAVKALRDRRSYRRHGDYLLRRSRTRSFPIHPKPG
jgi:hypothetical protein